MMLESWNGASRRRGVRGEEKRELGLEMIFRMAWYRWQEVVIVARATRLIIALLHLCYTHALHYSNRTLSILLQLPRVLFKAPYRTLQIYERQPGLLLRVADVCR